MKIKKALLILLFSITSLFAIPNTVWNKQNIFIEVNKNILEGDTYLLKNLVRLQNFYSNRQNKPIWLSNQGIKGKRVMQLLSSIQRDVTLDPRSHIHHKAKTIKKKLEQKHNNASIIKLELELTTLYYNFLQHTIYGEIDWKAFEMYLSNNQANGIDSNWVHYPHHFDVNVLMSQEDIGETLRHLTPNGYQYKQLISALYKLYKIKWQGGWTRLPAFKSLKKGQTSQMVSRLRQRLALSGDYICSSKVSDQYYGTCLQKAVKRFQKRHNTLADGVVGRGTQQLLNISVDSKINKVLLNLDRIKWLPRNVNPRHIVVNIPEYMLHYYEYGKEEKRLRVIVGDTEHPTPVFSDTLTYFTLNPYWKLPPGIIKKEVVPAMVKNPNYIKQHGLEVHETWEENSSVVPLNGIDWAMYLNNSTKFPYRLMQPPGPKNALGQIKFKFPNKFSVYLHDTPTKHLFKKKKRAFSHGCVRLSQPFSLLKSLAKDEPTITSEKVNNIIISKKKTEVDITKDIPIHLTYLTTWVNANNQLIFGDDIYQYDKYQIRRYN
jgi:murein L,D-transpeptidase YcbB/YkuD